MSTASKGPSGSLRVSDADRDRAIAELSGHPFHFAWLPVVAIIVIRLLVGGRGRRRCDRRAPR